MLLLGTAVAVFGPLIVAIGFLHDFPLASGFALVFFIELDVDFITVKEFPIVHVREMYCFLFWVRQHFI